MKKETDRFQIEEVPVFKASKQTIDEYLDEIISYCIYFHNETKQFESFVSEDAKEFYRYMLRNSWEPQYRLILNITIARNIEEEEGGELDGNTISDVFSDLEELKTYVKSLKAKTYKEIRIRSIAEYYYMDGLSVREVVKTLIAIKLLPEYGDPDATPPQKELTDSHIRTISRYFKSFKDFDVIKSDPK